ncbi:MAG: hypothetical protein LQ340_002832 [Diploschistes diacapsis]|nr:MAG: hypothetical protein LQ340_002832 [Diploschistes diacapsis]
MTTRRDGDRRGGEHRDDYPSKRPAQREAAAARPKLDEFWLDGEGIDRQDMLDDLKALSQAFIQENRNLRGHNRDEVRYEESQTRIRRDHPDYDTDRDRAYNQSTNPYPMPSQYSSEPPANGYPVSMYGSAPYPGGPSYTMAPPSSMPASYDTRYAQEYNYPPGSRDMPPPGYGYQTPNGYPDPGRAREMHAGFYAGQPVPRVMEDPRDPRFGGYDPMSGVQGPAYGVPPRGSNPSPYEQMPREHYARAPPSAADSYGTRRR